MPAIMVMILVAVLVFGASAVWGLVWAVRTGQFVNFNASARSIFDEEEPIGRMTDRFPGPQPTPTTPTPAAAKRQDKGMGNIYE